MRENAVGGGLEFYKLSWPIIQSFKEDFLFTIYNYATPPLKDGSMPFSHIINAYLNPFSDNIENFQLSNTIISFAIFLVFAKILKSFYKRISTIDIVLTSSVFLLLPFFRTSAFWGKNENYGWLFFIIALYFFNEIKKEITKNPNNKNIINIIFFCLASSCALYARQALVFLPISYLLYLSFNKSHNKTIIISLLLFAFLAVPGTVLILIWRDVYASQTVFLPISFRADWLHPKFILYNIPILLSFFGFYLLPVLIIEFINTNYKLFFNKYLKSFFFSFFIFIILSQINALDYLSHYVLGGGVVIKLNYLIDKNNYLLLFIFSSIGFSILMRLFKEDIKNNVTIVLPIFFIYGFTHILYQEYVEPLILVLFFIAIKTELHKEYFRNINLSNFIFLSYFSIYLVGSIYFKHFAFSSLESWRNFLGL